MYDMLPFPNPRGNTTEEKLNDLVNYLIQFKETLEFTLTNITAENLSPDLVNRLNELGTNIEQTNSERESELAQISQRHPLTVNDVVNTEAFKDAVNNGLSKLSFNINFENGCLEYDFE